MVATCGSGITASVVAFAAFMLGKDVPVYDVSLILASLPCERACTHSASYMYMYALASSDKKFIIASIVRGSVSRYRC